MTDNDEQRRAGVSHVELGETMEEKPWIEAATTLLVRDGAGGIEVFLMVRHEASRSFSGAAVFPGGKVDASDGDPALPSRCRGAESLDDKARALRVAGIREAFEECGVLLAREAGGQALSAARHDRIVARWREPLLAGEAHMAEIAEAEDLLLETDTLVPFAHWITPKVAPRIFDTHFFLARAPAAVEAGHDGGEGVDSAWMRPADAVARAEAGELMVIFPTRLNLLKLAASDTVAEALAAARARAIVTVRPEARPHPDGRHLHIPLEAGYGASDFVVGKDGVFRRPL